MIRDRTDATAAWVALTPEYAQHQFADYLPALIRAGDASDDGTQLPAQPSNTNRRELRERDQAQAIAKSVTGYYDF